MWGKKIKKGEFGGEKVSYFTESCIGRVYFIKEGCYMSCYGWVAERLNAPVLKTGKGASPSWVRIPPHPPKYSAKTTLLI